MVMHWQQCLKKHWQQFACDRGSGSTDTCSAVGLRTPAIMMGEGSAVVLRFFTRRESWEMFVGNYWIRIYTKYRINYAIIE